MKTRMRIGGVVFAVSSFLLIYVVFGGCSGDSETSDGGDGGGANDGGTPVDAGGHDAGTQDAGYDAGQEDTGQRDAGADAGADTGLDGGLDAGTDSGHDTGTDAGADTGDGGDAGEPFPQGYCQTSQCFPVPPTNQTTCYNNSASIACPDTAGSATCAATAFCGQNAQYPNNTRTYTCYNAGGTVQNPCDVTADADEVVTDSLTGLMWQRTWATAKTWQQALDYCDTLTYGGHEDWRLPNPFELQSIVDDGRYGPSIDTTVFPGTPSDGFWSSSSYAGNATNAWSVYFNDGYVDGDAKTNAGGVRCVRGGPVESGIGSFDRFGISGAGEQVVSDSVTGLVWQKNSETYKTWQQALAYCESLVYGGQSDWRLPDQKELMSLVNYGRESPASDFPDMPSDVFWSSSSYAADAAVAWHVYFNYGYVVNTGKGKIGSVRCVRGGP